jgi:hypothetical protein
MTETTWELLDEIVKQTTYRPGWEVELYPLEPATETSAGVMELHVTSLGYNTHHLDRGETYRVIHGFIVPQATYNEQSWIRWILDRLTDVETHEACEFFRVGGKLPFAPNHGPGWNPYGVRELNRVEAETTNRGQRREGTQA